MAPKIHAGQVCQLPSFLLTRAHLFWLFSHFLNLIVSMIVMLRITWLKDAAMERAEHVASTP